MTNHHPPFALTPVEISVFSAQNFDRCPPGTVLADFETLLKIVGEAGMPATSTQLEQPGPDQPKPEPSD